MDEHGQGEHLTAWRELALELPQLHARLREDPADAELGRRAAVLEAPSVAALHSLEREEAREVALDVLMVEAFYRRHAESAPLPAEAGEQVAAAAEAVAQRMGMKPILSYPLYIRHNPLPPRTTRRFTDLDAELRFIRMHRFIEDLFDRVIELLTSIAEAPERHAALAEAIDELRGLFRRINRVMAAFRDPQRMPNEAFLDGFRPYYDAVYDEDGKTVLLDGPSGLQSPTFRIVTTLCGYEDRVLDDWTRRISRYHEPEERERLRNAQRARDAGDAMRDTLHEWLPGGRDLPHLHPSYGEHMALLFDRASAGGWLRPDTRAQILEMGLEATQWPAPPVEGGPVRPGPRLLEAAAGSRGDARNMDALEAYADLEAMLFGFHVEHVAVALMQIGHERGTGGTSGVEFLQLALFRRAFPELWLSGLGAELSPPRHGP